MDQRVSLAGVAGVPEYTTLTAWCGSGVSTALAGNELHPSASSAPHTHNQAARHGRVRIEQDKEPWECWRRGWSGQVDSTGEYCCGLCGKVRYLEVSILWRQKLVMDQGMGWQVQPGSLACLPCLWNEDHTVRVPVKLAALHSTNSSPWW